MKIPGYEIERTIGEGGMATAYLAVQDSLGRKVVLKVLSATSQDSPETVERFLNEGRIIASLNHPHIVTIFDIGTAEEGVYISMEYIEGGDLKTKLGSEIFSPKAALEMLVKIASALDAAHKKGIVHRDVKPANILFRRDGTPLLSDFGIAKQLSVDHDLTSTGIFLGSPNYMAPEQAEAGPIDGRADIYSLGIILFEMLTGAKPFQSDSVVDIIVQHRQAPIPNLPDGLEPYQELLDLMMAKRRRDRFRDCDSLIHYIKHMERTGAVRSDAELVEAPDLDITNSGPIPELNQKPEVPLLKKNRQRKTKPQIHGSLIVILILVAMGFMSLQVIGRKMRADERPSLSNLTVQNAAPEIDRSSEPAGSQAPIASSEVVNALAWLARKSLDEFRLTSPPKDNAYYYYSRLLEINPNDPAARRGVLLVAERFAALAERELAQNNIAQAKSYISIGLQLDPNNESLAALRGLTKPQKRGFFETILSFFQRG